MIDYLQVQRLAIKNSVIFSGKPMGSEEFLNRIVEVLSIAVDRCPRERPRKREN